MDIIDDPNAPIPPPQPAPTSAPVPPPGFTPIGPVAPLPPDPGGETPPTTGSDADTTTLPPDLVGDVPPPPVPMPPIVGTGVAGITGTEGSTLARPGTHAAIPFRTAAFHAPTPRFGPGVPQVGADSTGMGGLTPEQIAEILRNVAAGRMAH